MDILPNELLSSIFINCMIDDHCNINLINKKCYNIVKITNEKYWQKYNYINYEVTVLFNKFSYFKMALEIHDFLSLITEYRIFVPVEHVTKKN